MTAHLKDFLCISGGDRLKDPLPERITWISHSDKGIKFVISNLYKGSSDCKKIESLDYRILARAIYDYGIHPEYCWSASRIRNFKADCLLLRAVEFYKKVKAEIAENKCPHTTDSDIWYYNCTEKGEG
tara:strand:- start:91 stop:474 length:384 start_codon:yes stop_codon:yes gene_type:complete